MGLGATGAGFGGAATGRGAGGGAAAGRGAAGGGAAGLGGAATGRGGGGAGRGGAATGLGAAAGGFGGAAAGFGGGAVAGFAGGFFLGSTAGAGACACATPAAIGSTIETAGNSASAGTKVPASKRLLSFMVIPRGVVRAVVFIRCERRSTRPSHANAKANLWNQTERTFMLRCGWSESTAARSTVVGRTSYITRAVPGGCR
jgi:hypothetical protein